jgi:hypothetical protein
VKISNETKSKIEIYLQLGQRRIQAQELSQSVQDFTQAHTNLLLRINVLSNNLRTARLAGHTIQDIEALMATVKVSKRIFSFFSDSFCLAKPFVREGRGKLNLELSHLATQTQQKKRQCDRAHSPIALCPLRVLYVCISSAHRVEVDHTHRYVYIHVF